MNYEIKQEDKRTVAGFHLVGPWEQTVKKGFEQLMMLNRPGNPGD